MVTDTGIGITIAGTNAVTIIIITATDREGALRGTGQDTPHATGACGELRFLARVGAQPLMQTMGSTFATLRARPARSAASTTAPTSL